MKLGVKIQVLLLLFGTVSSLWASDSTNKLSGPDVSWQIISNQWCVLPFEKVQQAANRGDLTAEYYLAVAYQDGLSVSKDPEAAFKWMKLVAEQGRTKAQGNLGRMYEYGIGTETNLSQAVVWYQKAAGQGDAWAQMHIGWMYETGTGMEKNISHAYDLYQQAAAQGNAQAQMNLGWMYEHGEGVDQDYSLAAKYYRKAADQGHPMAQNNLGWLYRNGLGVPDDPREALKWLQKSAEQGEPFAEANLAYIYAGGVYGPTNHWGQGAKAQILSGGIVADHDLAEKWMRKAVDLDTPEGQYKYAKLLCSEFDTNGAEDDSHVPEAGQWFKKAAEKGHVDAEFELAELYNFGKLGGDQRTNCIPWYLKAAAAGHIGAQSKVGELTFLYPGNPLLQSVDIIQTQRHSAEQGDLEAQYQLAMRYQRGIGVVKDPVEAFQWMEKAAENNSASSRVGMAMFKLAQMYENGEGVTKDIEKAHELYLGATVAYRESAATWRVGKMYEEGDGVPQDDVKAVEFYSNEMCETNSPSTANGLIIYLDPDQEGIVSVLRLWAQGRGFPDKDKTTKLGYQSPDSLLKQWEGSINTAEEEFNVGRIYYQGKLVPTNAVEAACRFRVAAKHGFQEAQKKLEEVENVMTPIQKEQANHRFGELDDRFKQASYFINIRKSNSGEFPFD